MNLRKFFAAGLLGVAAIVLAAQVPAENAYGQTKAEKKALKQKLAAQKEAQAKKDVTPADAKPAPTDIKPPAAPAHPTPTASLARLIDQQIDARLSSGAIQPSPETADGEFIRRVSLDIVGVIPSPEKAAAFIDDRSPDKRAKLIDELLEDTHYGRRMADVWTSLMYLVDSDNRFISKAPLHEWLEEKFN
ncbi:MAG TPA: DUF1549 domain-containing protein, partial [Gemmataceae bacterium]|nr:DUF1549 domain-containing protein [Gemmataceae bacterium]